MSAGDHAAIIRSPIASPLLPIHEAVLNMSGLELMWSGSTDGAVAMQRLRSEQFPGSANADDRCADAMLTNGDTVGALEDFKKSSEMDGPFIAIKEKILAIEAAALPGVE